MIIPSYLINGSPNIIAYLNKQIQFVALTKRNKQGLINNLPLSLSPWIWQIKTDPKQVDLTIKNAHTEELIFKAALPANLSLTNTLNINAIIILQPIDNQTL